MLRWFQGVQYKMDKGIKALIDHAKWRAGNIPRPLTNKVYETLVWMFFNMMME